MRKTTVAAIQMGCGSDVKENIEKASELIREAAAQGAQVILPPELFERPYFCQERRYEYYGYARTPEEDDAVIHMKKLAKELELLEKIKAHLEDGRLAKTFDAVEDEEEEEWLKSYNLLTYKPVIYAANVSEDDLADDGASNPHVAKVREMAKEEGAEVFVICAQIEQELAELDEDEKKEYLEDLGVESSGLDKLVAASYSLLGLISFLTAGEDECRAWTIKKGTKAPQAAGKIHTDFERGFIKAEVVNYQDLLDNGSLAAAREKGIVGMEGKDYVVKDGDVILFRFNV